MILFVMNAWPQQQNIKNVKLFRWIPTFTRFMGMLVGKPVFCMRSWRYMAIVQDGVIENGGKNPNQQ